MKQISKKINKLASTDFNSIKSDSDSKKIWDIYINYCKKKCNLEEKIFSTSENNRSKLKTMELYNYFDFKNEDCSIEERYLSPLFEHINSYHDKPSPKLMRSCLQNTTVAHDVEMIKNMVFCDKISDENLMRLRQYLIESGIKEVIESYYGCYSAITNVRLSRWSHNPENIHVKEKFAREPNGQLMRDVGYHYDAGLPDDVLKVFIYKSANSKNKIVNEKHGLTQIKINGNFITSASRKYSVIVFNSKKIYHQAPCPAFEHDRDSIEVTILPRIEDDFLVVQAGNMAGMTKNPFQQWDI